MVVRTHVVDTASLNRLLTSRDGAVARTILQRALRVETRAKQKASADRGRLRQSITHEIVMTNGKPSARVGTNVDYARAVHNGTGLYGPHQTPIVPTTRKLLRFTKGSRVIFARSVRGQKANPFLKDALRE